MGRTWNFLNTSEQCRAFVHTLFVFAAHPERVFTRLEGVHCAAHLAGAHLANGAASTNGVSGGVGSGGSGAVAGGRGEAADVMAAGLAAAVAAAAAQAGGGGDSKEAMAAVEANLARIVDAVGPDQEVWYYLDPQVGSSSDAHKLCILGEVEAILAKIGDAVWPN